jgi:hypothetical protein
MDDRYYVDSLLRRPAGRSHPPQDPAGGGRPRVAFYGRTNTRGAAAAVALARQYRACCDAAAGRAEVTRFFFDLPEPPDELMVLAVRDSGGPPRRDGGWDDLAAAMAGADRAFDVVLCTGLDRIGRRLACLSARLQTAAEDGVAIVSADVMAGWPSATASSQVEPARTRSTRDLAQTSTRGRGGAM